MIEPVNKQTSQEEGIQLVRFPLGLNTVDPARTLGAQELADCVNFDISNNGRLVSRYGVKEHWTSSNTSAILMIAQGSINGSSRTVLSTSNKKLYYINGGALTEIATSDNRCYLVPYNDVMMVMDGGYLKYLDGVSSASLKLAYDAAGSLYDTISDGDDAYLGISEHATYNIQAGMTYTTPNWGSLNFPTTLTVSAKLKRAGTIAAGTYVYCLLARATGNTIDAYGKASKDAVDISTEGETITFAMTGTPQPNTSYRIIFTATYAPNTSNYIQLRTSTVSSGGVGIQGAITMSGSYPTWTISSVTATAKTTHIPLVKVEPGLAPQCDYGVVKESRLFVAKATQGTIWYSNLTHLDWSTEGGGGYIGIADSASTVGGLQALFGELYIFGTMTMPYMAKLTGTSPEDFAVELVYNNIYASQYSLINANSDLWFTNINGVGRVSGVVEYGDVRAFSDSDLVSNKIRQYGSNDYLTFAGYRMGYGQYWLKLAYSTNVLVFHSKFRYSTETGSKSPVTEYKFPFTPSCFYDYGSYFLIGSTGGKVYAVYDGLMDTTPEYFDNTSTAIAPTLKTAVVQIPNAYKEEHITGVELFITAPGGASLVVDIYKNDAATTKVHTETVTIPTSDSALSTYSFFIDTNFNARAVQVGISSVAVTTGLVSIEGFIVKHRRM